MEAIQFTRKELKLEHVRRPRPKIINPHDVIIKVFFSGICRKDLDIIDGILPCNADKPFFLGHEFCGVASDVGEEVSTIKKGDKVVVDPNSGCGVCDVCRIGRASFCKVSGNNSIGFYKNGGWAQYVSVPEPQVYKIPESLSIEYAVLTEPLACIAHGWDIVSPVTMGQKILIVGTGLIGDLWAALLHFQGHRKVTVCEPNLTRLEYVQKMVTDFECITPDELKEIQKNDPMYLFDLIIDTIGSKTVMNEQFSLLNSGGKCCIFGVKPPDAQISVSAFDIYQKEFTIVGVNNGIFDFPKALTILESIQEKYIDFEMLGIKMYPLRNFAEAIDDVRKRNVVKAIFSNAIQCSCPKKKGDS